MSSTQVATSLTPTPVLASTQRATYIKGVLCTKKKCTLCAGEVHYHVSLSRQSTHNTVHFLAALCTAASEDFMACLPHTAATTSTIRSATKCQKHKKKVSMCTSHTSRGPDAHVAVVTPRGKALPKCNHNTDIARMGQLGSLASCSIGAAAVAKSCVWVYAFVPYPLCQRGTLHRHRRLPGTHPTATHHRQQHNHHHHNQTSP